jgi:hypothetical protein
MRENKREEHKGPPEGREGRTAGKGERGRGRGGVGGWKKGKR